MKGDFSRDTFDPRKHYAGLVMQQGRVQLDADWNEQHSIDRHRTQVQARDVIGGSGAPVHDAGFQLTTADGKAVTIGAGRYYVAGLLCENEAAVDYTAQPDLPAAPAIAATLAAAGTTVGLFFLQAWRRTVTALDDPEIREVALGGPDTALRLKTVWQVKLLPVKPPAAGTVACGDSLPEWDALVAGGTGMMSARAQPVVSTDNPCLMPPGAGYQRQENQLYRVEIHKGGPNATATFKWSRDNGAVVTAVEAFNGQELTVHDLGRDETLGFAAGQSVELVDDSAELSRQPGQLLSVDHVDEQARIVALKSSPAAVAGALHPKLRRWDSGELALSAATTPDGWIALEDGVQVRFEAGTYATGDYWLVPARAVTGGIDWPFATPQRPRDRLVGFERIGIVTTASGVLAIQDCRKLFAPLAEKPAAVHVTGISWVHDDVIGQTQLQTSGLQVFFDGTLTPPPGDAGAAVVSVTLEMPVPLKTFNAQADASATTHLNVPLSGDIGFSGNTLLWKPATGGAELASLAAALVAQQVSRVRLRVHLRGNGIWREGGTARVYLDGATLGQGGFRADSTPRIDLLFPSGQGRQCSDFESWLYLQLQLPAAKLLGVAVVPAVVNAGAAATGTVTLDNPAPAAGLSVTLTSSSASATVPATVSVPAGKTQAAFNVATTAAQNTQDVLITASAAGVVMSAPLRLQVVSVAVSPAEVTIFTGHAQQFSAQVSGATDTGVAWSVQEAGGSINTTGLFVGTAAGDFHVVATSTANPAQRGTALIHVRNKTKDKEKEKEKDKEKDKELLRENPNKLVAIEHLPLVRPVGVAAPLAAANDDDPPGLGRAFIRPDERPDLTRPATP